MANVLVNDASLKAIGDSIRKKTGSKDSYKPAEMAAAIDGISSGSSDLNIIFGSTAPSDTTALWIEGEKPIKTTMSSKFLSGGGSSIQNIEPGLPVGMKDTTAAAVGTNCYIFGGRAATDVDTIVKLDTLTNEITTLNAKLPYAVSDASCAAVGTNCYIFGGASGSIMNTIIRFDTRNNRVKKLPTTLPQAMYLAGCAAVGKSCYLFGGYGSSYYDTILKFDTETNKVETLTTKLPEPTIYISCAAVGSDIYLFGGSGAYNGKSRKIYKFDTISNKLYGFSTQLPEPLDEACACSVGTNCYIFGGDGPQKLTTILKFDSLTGDISVMPAQLPIGVNQISCAAVGSNCYVFGGSDNSSNKLTTISKLSTAVKLNNNEVFIFSDEKSHNAFRLVNSDSMIIEAGVKGVYRGDKDNYAQNEIAKVYRNGQWEAI